MFLKDTTLVLGHRNPDTDAIASAMGYAWLLNQLHNGGYQAGRLGEVNVQTEFALNRFKVEAPPLVSDVYLRVEDVTRREPSLKPDATIRDACKHFEQHRRPVVVLKDDLTVAGLVTAASLFNHMALSIVSDSYEGLDERLRQGASSAVEARTVVFEAGQRVGEVMRRLPQTEQDDFVVVDTQGHYLGLCRRADWFTPPKQRLVLVDHNEVSQAAPGIEEAEVVEILDHHRLNTITTITPIAMRVSPIGSTSTLVYERAKSVGLTVPAHLAGLLLCGILSDTLIFASPTATERDHQAAAQLAQAAGLDSDEGDATGAIETLGRALLAAGAGLGTRSADEIIHADLKFYTVGGSEVGLAQVEVTDFAELLPRATELYEELKRLVEGRGLALALLMVTDIVVGRSRLLVAGQTSLIAALPFTRLDTFTLDAPGVVSRKKQLAPAVLAALSQ